MKKVLSVILSFAIMLTILPFGLFSIPIKAAEENCTWSLDDTWLTISGSGKIEDHFYKSVLNDASITIIMIKDGEISLGDYAFEGCSGLEVVFFNDAVKNIGEGAFSGCSNLNLVSFSKNVENIEKNAFAECKNLETVSISNLSMWFNIKFENHFSNPLTYAQDLEINGTPVTDIVIPDNVTAINDYAFYNCISLKSVSLPKGVSKIGKNAFENCTSLTDVTITDAAEIGDSAFKDCIALKNLSIGKGLNVINDFAFENCYALESISLPTGLSFIGKKAFYNCKNLADISFPDSITHISERALYNTAWYNNQNDGIIYAGKVLYKYKGYCPATVNVKDGTLAISDKAFYYCDTLKSVTIPDSVISIGVSAFENCNALENATLGEGVTKLSDNVFSNCAMLQKIYIPSNIVEISASAFEKCYAISSIDVAKGNTVYYSAGNCLIETELNELILGCKNSIIPYNVTHICDYAFDNCKSLKRIVIPASVTCIESTAFYGCSDLVSIEVKEGNSVYHSENNCLIKTATNELILGCKNSIIPDYVTSICDYAFYNCTELESITIGKNVTYIHYSAFNNCSKLKDITLFDSTIAIDSNAFYSCCALSDVYFIGNRTDCADTDILYGNTALADATWHYKSDIPSSANFALYVNNSNNKSEKICLNEFGMPAVSLESGKTYTLKFDVYTVSEGASGQATYCGITNNGTDAMAPKSFDMQTVKSSWQTNSFEFTTTAILSYHTICANAGFIGYFDNFRIFDGETELNLYEFDASALETRNTTAKGIILHDDIINRNNSDYDYAVYIDNSQNGQSKTISLHKFGMNPAEIMADKKYTLKFKTYALSTESNGYMIYRGITDIGTIATEPKFFEAYNTATNIWQTHTLEIIPTDTLDYHTISVNPGFVGYLDDFCIYDGETKIAEYAFDYKSLDIIDKNCIGTTLPETIADEKNFEYNYGILIDNSSASDYGKLYLHELGMPDIALPIGNYTVKFDFYIISLGNGNFPIQITNPNWNGDALSQKWINLPNKVGQWSEISLSFTTTDVASFPWFYVGAGIKGYMDNFRIIDNNTNLTCLNFELTPDDYGKISETINSVVTIPKEIDKTPVQTIPAEPDYAIYIDNSKNTAYGQLYLHEVGMPNIKLPAGSYTAKFKFYALSIGNTNFPIQITNPNWTNDALPQKWINLPNKVGEWAEISLSYTTTDISSYPWFYVGAGIKGYLDNFKIIDNKTGEVCLNFKATAYDLGKTSKNINTVVELPQNIAAQKDSVSLETPDYGIYIDNSSNSIQSSQIWFNNLGMNRLELSSGKTYTLEYDTYALSVSKGSSCYVPVNKTGGGVSTASNDQNWFMATDQLYTWKTQSVSFTIEDILAYHTLYVGSGFKGYLDNFRIYYDGTQVALLTFDLSCLGKTSGGATVVELDESIVSKKNNCQHTYDITIENADCVEAGKYIYSCIKCGYNYTSTIEKIDHKYTAKMLEPTCTTAGHTIYTCSVCGDIRVINETLPLAHRYSTTVTTPTCTKTGFTSYSCSECNVTFNAEKVATLNHSFDNESDTVCNDCGFTREAETPHAHTYGDAVVTPAKPGIAGVKTYTCTVCGDVKTEAIDALAEVKFAGASLGLRSNITFNFYVYESLFQGTGYTDAYITFQIGTKNVTVSEYTTYSNMRIYAFSDIAPHQMNDKVHAVLHITYEGEEYTGFIDYAIIDYVNRQFESLKTGDSQGETRALLVDLLNYGAATQIYAKSNVNNLVNANLTEEQKAWGTQTDIVPGNILNQEYAVIDNPTATVSGAALVLKDAIVVRTYITVADTTGVSIQFKSGGKTWTYDAEDFTEYYGMQYVDFNGLNPAQMKDAIEITVMKDGAAISNTTLYSIETYAAIQFAKEGVEQELIDLLKAMLKYGNSTYNYAN